MPVKTKSNGKKQTRAEREQAQEHARVLLKKWLKTNALDAMSQDVKTTLMADDAKRLLGWMEVEQDHQFVDRLGNKIVCYNNMNNRPWSNADIDKIAQDILTCRYAFNGETIVIGVDGNVIQGQKRLIALVFAEQMRASSQQLHWSTYWNGPCSIECVVVYNVDASMKTTRTLDNTKPRTVADSLFTDSELAKFNTDERRKFAKVFELAISVLWKRTGRSNDFFTSKKTSSELLSYKDRHPHLIKAVKHIWEEESRNENGTSLRRISGPGRWIGAGTAAALLYLMGCSQSREKVYNSPKPNKEGIVEVFEKGLDWGMWEKACEFWVMLASVGDDLKAADPRDDDFIKNLRRVRQPVENSSDKYSGYVFLEGSSNERAAALCKAWNVWIGGEKPTPGMFKLAFKTSASGKIQLDEDPTVGGIDLGNYPHRPSQSADGDTGGSDQATNSDNSKEAEDSDRKETDPTPEEIEKEKAAIRAENGHATETANA